MPVPPRSPCSASGDRHCRLGRARPALRRVPCLCARGGCSRAAFICTGRRLYLYRRRQHWQGPAQCVVEPADWAWAADMPTVRREARIGDGTIGAAAIVLCDSQAASRHGLLRLAAQGQPRSAERLGGLAVDQAPVDGLARIRWVWRAAGLGTRAHRRAARRAAEGLAGERGWRRPVPDRRPWVCSGSARVSRRPGMISCAVRSSPCTPSARPMRLAISCGKSPRQQALQRARFRGLPEGGGRGSGSEPLHETIVALLGKSECRPAPRGRGPHRPHVGLGCSRGCGARVAGIRSMSRQV